MAGKHGFGTQFARETTLGGGDFETIASISDISGPERTREMTDVTAHDSPEKYMEFVKGLKDAGEISITLNYDPSQNTHQSLDDDYDEAELRAYQIVILPDEDEEHTWEASCGISDIGDSFPVDDRMEREVTFKVSGVPTLTNTGGS